MDINNIQSTLQEVLGGTFSGIHTYYLQYVLQLVGYYAEDDLTEQEKAGFNQVNALLIKYAELNHLLSCIQYTLTNKESVANYTNLFIEMRNAILQIDNQIDVASLICYIKRKAVKSGDWPIYNEK